MKNRASALFGNGGIAPLSPLAGLPAMRSNTENPGFVISRDYARIGGVSVCAAGGENQQERAMEPLAIVGTVR